MVDSSIKFHSSATDCPEVAPNAIIGTYDGAIPPVAFLATSATPRTENNAPFASILHKSSIRPLCIDLFCGLGGWAEGFLAEGYRVIGFDVERHRYPMRVIDSQSIKAGGIDFNQGDSFNGTTEKRFARAPLTGGWDQYPGELVLQDVLTLHGSQFRHADVIVASPPCQKYSYMAMPWSRAKREIRWQLWECSSPFGNFTLNDLFDVCFRIQREASEAAGRSIPLVVENVKGAQRWVGRAAWHYGSYYLWGDVPALMPSTAQALATKNNGGSSFPQAHNTDSGHSRNPVSGEGYERTHPNALGQLKRPGTKQTGSGSTWFDIGIASHGSQGSARKTASAQIAKIPFPLAHWIAQIYRPPQSGAKFA